MSGPLEGLKILDFTTLLPGPYATMTLADMGADVLRIISGARPDMVAFFPPFVPGTDLSAIYAYLGRGKRCMTLNLKASEGQAILLVDKHLDALTKLGDLAAERGDANLSAELRARALDVWLKISPIEEYTPERLDTYGLPPHQQPADVYFGDGYSGRGGWSWYTGAAARMLTAAHGILGVCAKDGEIVLAEHAAQPKGRLRLRRVVHNGRTIFDRD